MKIFIYNKNEIREITENQLSKVELDNRDLPESDRLQVLEADFFPYAIAENGSLILDENKNPILLTTMEKAAKGYISLDVVKDELKQKAKQKEQATIDLGFTFKTHLIDSDSDSQRFISSLLIAANSGIITEFKGFTTKNDIDIDLNAANIGELAGLCLLHISNAHKEKRETYRKIEAADTVSQLKEILFLYNES